MKKSVLALLLLSSLSAGAQTRARLVFNNTGGLADHPWMVFNPDTNLVNNPGTYLVLDNESVTAITVTGSAMNVVPNIKSEGEQNKVRWRTGVTVTNPTVPYVVPYGSTAGNPMYLEILKTSVGIGGATSSLILSTYNSSGRTAAGSGWDNSQYKPTGVTHMGDYTMAATDNSQNAIDRFWIVDPKATTYLYSTPPTVSMTFHYDALDAAVNGGNTPGMSAFFQAQRFNTTLGKWGDITPMGSTGVNQVSGVAPPVADFFRVWTQAHKIQPQPIELVEWSGACDGKNVKLTWKTASEQNNDHFTIEKSLDAAAWYQLGEVASAGNSSSMHQYSYIDVDSKKLAYYRLRQTDIDGASTVGDVIAAGCEGVNGTELVNAWDDGNVLNVVVNSTVDATYDLTLMDAQGKIMVVQPSRAINTGVTTLKVDKHLIATGIYVVQLQNSTDVMTRRVILQ